MNDEPLNEEHESLCIGSNPIHDFITDLAAEPIAPGIPAPVRRRFLKALVRLCSAAIDFPIAYLTGKADERRAETEARVRLVNTTADQISHQMRVDPEYARVAVQKFGQRVLRDQVNLDLISQKAAIEIRDANHTVEQSEEEISRTINDDWLNTFEAEARHKSTEEMQAYFGKVLAGEIRKPDSFSIRTLRILAGLDQETATHFARLCSMSIESFHGNVRVSTLGGNAASNALQKYGLPFSSLNLLNEHGLIIADFNSWQEYMPCLEIDNSRGQVILLPFAYQGKHWMLRPTSKESINKKIKIHGVALTKSGRELSKIVKCEPVNEYSKDLYTYIERSGFRMVEVTNGGAVIVDIDAAMGLNTQ